MTSIQRFNLTLRTFMELGVVYGFAYWGYRTGGVALAIAAPVVGFGLWGAVGFHQFGRSAEALRLIQELALTGLAAIGLYAAGSVVPACALASLSILHHALVYPTGNRLLKGGDEVRP